MLKYIVTYQKSLFVISLAWFNVSGRGIGRKIGETCCFFFSRKHVRDFTAVRARNDMGYLKFDLKTGRFRFSC